MLNVAATPVPPTASRVPYTTPHTAPRVVRRVRCEVVVAAQDGRYEDGFARDLLPWADPYIASLAAALQREEELHG